MKSGNMKSNQGFTLLELLIALGLFASITGILMSSFFQFHRQANRMETILRLRQELRVLEQIIRNDVQAVVYLEEFMNDPQKQKDGRKTGILGIDEAAGEVHKDQLHMHVNSASRFHRNLTSKRDPELHEISYFLEETDDEKFKFKRREEFFIDSDITDGDRSIVHTLSTRIVSFNVKYFKATETETLDEWDSSGFLSTGNPADKIPAGLVINLKISSEDGETLLSEMQINLQPYMGQHVTWGASK